LDLKALLVQQAPKARRAQKVIPVMLVLKDHKATRDRRVTRGMLAPLDRKALQVAKGRKG
jgi:hypothetical protein